MKKVNKEAVENAVKRVGRNYLESKCFQSGAIIYVGPIYTWVSADDIIGLIIRLTGKIHACISGEQGGNLALCIFVKNLLPEFIVDGEEWTNDEG